MGSTASTQLESIPRVVVDPSPSTRILLTNAQLFAAAQQRYAIDEGRAHPSPPPSKSPVPSVDKLIGDQPTRREGEEVKKHKKHKKHHRKEGEPDRLPRNESPALSPSPPVPSSSQPYSPSPSPRSSPSPFIMDGELCIDERTRALLAIAGNPVDSTPQLQVGALSVVITPRTAHARRIAMQQHESRLKSVEFNAEVQRIKNMMLEAEADELRKNPPPPERSRSNSPISPHPGLPAIEGGGSRPANDLAAFTLNAIKRRQQQKQRQLERTERKAQKRAARKEEEAKREAELRQEYDHQLADRLAADELRVQQEEEAHQRKLREMEEKAASIEAEVKRTADEARRAAKEASRLRKAQKEAVRAERARIAEDQAVLAAAEAVRLEAERKRKELAEEEERIRQTQFEREAAATEAVQSRPSEVTPSRPTEEPAAAASPATLNSAAAPPATITATQLRFKRANAVRPVFGSAVVATASILSSSSSSAAVVHSPLVTRVSSSPPRD